MINRKILAQGDRDGACFVYSVANAVGALRKQITQPKWDSFIKKMPVRVDDFLHGEGTGRIADNEHLLEAVARTLVDVSGLVAQVSSVRGLNSAAELKRNLTSSAVVIVCINEAGHWVALLEVAGRCVHVACSALLLNEPSGYNEAQSPVFKRTYNLTRKIDDLDIYQGYGLRIELCAEI